jgi:3-hydroxybutyryl-CoA dehydratase
MDTTAFEKPFDELPESAPFVSRGRTLTEGDVVAFATLTGDFHPLHVDAEWAARGPFGERVAHGLLVSSYAVGLLPFDPERLVALRRIKDMVFKRPARLGDTIHVEGTLEPGRAVSDAAGLVTAKLSVRDQRGALLCRMAVEVLWARAAAPVDDAGVPEIDFVPIPL